jgi:hypothetical protein
MFRDKEDGCIKVVLKPWADAPTLQPDRPGRDQQAGVLH